MRSFFVCFSYDFKAALKMAWKLEEAVDVEADWDMGEVTTEEEVEDDLPTSDGDNEEILHCPRTALRTYPLILTATAD